MNGLIRHVLKIGVAIFVMAAIGGTSRLQAQHFTCWQCVLDQGTQTYSCQYGGSIGWNSCSYSGGQGCQVGTKCGLYRALADGTFEQVVNKASVRDARPAKRSTSASALVGHVAMSRIVERGCNGTIVRRSYDATASFALKQASRSIHV